jgi:hypothetical protein
VCRGDEKLPSGPLVVTWPCFTEAMYLLHRASGHAAQAALWQLHQTGRLLLHESTESEVIRIAELMAKYADLPMDLADASIVAAAEHLGTRKVFTIDRDFHIYRFADGTAVEITPQ